MKRSAKLSSLRAGNRWSWWVLAGLMLVMFCGRIFPGWAYVVKPDGELRLPSPDAHYHFRQAAYTMDHYPLVSRRDDFSFYPELVHDDAAGLYNLGLASAAKVLVLTGMEPRQALKWVCLLFPPLGATAIMALVFLLVRRQGDELISLTMALWYVLLPGLTLAQVTIGISDHHVVEMFISVWCVLALQRLVATAPAQSRPWWNPAFPAALPLAALQFTWLGGPLFLVIFAIATFGQLAADVWAGREARPTVTAGLRYWGAFIVLTGLFGLIAPVYVMLPTIWRASLQGAAVMVGLLAVIGWWIDTPRLSLKPVTRLALGVGGAAVLVTLAAMFSSSFQYYLASGLSPKTTIVAEQQEVTPRFYFGVTGLAGILGILTPLVGIVTGVWRRPAWWIGVLPSLLFVGLWCRTYDYGYQAALHAVILTGFFFSAIDTALRQHQTAPRWWQTRTWLALGTTAVILCHSPAKWTAPWWIDPRWYEGESGMPDEGWVEAMRWMRHETPEPPPRTESAADGLPRGRAGVLTDWVTGNFVNTLGERPATSSRYPVAQGMHPFFARSEESVRAAPLRGSSVADAVRYVAISPSTIAGSFHAHRILLGKPPTEFYGRRTFENAAGDSIAVPSLGLAYDEAFATRLLLHDGKGLSHFRLVFESRQMSFLRFLADTKAKAIVPRSDLIRTPGDLAAVQERLRSGIWKEGDLDAYLGHLIATVKIYEQVRGAQITGRAPAGSRVVLDSPLLLRNTGRTWHHQIEAITGDDGVFTITTPYPTEPVAGAEFVPAGQTVLSLMDSTEAGGDAKPVLQVPLTIPEGAVQHGAAVVWQGWLGRAPE